MTLEEFKKLFPSLKSERLNWVYNQLTPVFEKYEINTPLRKSHFLAQVAHETGGFRYLEEIASGDAYENRRDLGNIIKGDGRRYKGRGSLQLTGRSNYQIYGKELGVDLLSNPQLVASQYYMDVGGWYWNRHKLNTYADKDDIKTITRLINGGYNGLEDRTLWLAKFKRVYNI